MTQTSLFEIEALNEAQTMDVLPSIVVKTDLETFRGFEINNTRYVRNLSIPEKAKNITPIEELLYDFLSWCWATKSTKTHTTIEWQSQSQLNDTIKYAKKYLSYIEAKLMKIELTNKKELEKYYRDTHHSIKRFLDCIERN